MSLTEGDSAWSIQRREHVLGPPVKDGDGTVFSLPAPQPLVARIYEIGFDVATWERRVAAMLDRRPHLPDIIEGDERHVRIAWPDTALRNGYGQFAGFLMPAVDGKATARLEFILQERQARAEGLPTGLGAKVLLAASLSLAIAELHQQGHRVVDLTPAYLRFYPQSLHIALIDCDRFSIQGKDERFAVDLGFEGLIAPHYLAPEFQNQPIPPDGEEAQDRFALAVLIFQLLNFGIHPFTGRPTHDQVPTDIPGRIAARCYAYGLQGNPDLEPSPGSAHLTMPDELRSLFDRAFEGDSTTRPSARDWDSWLQICAMPSNNYLVVCRANAGHHHFFNMPCAACARTQLMISTANASNISLTEQPDESKNTETHAFATPETAVNPAPSLMAWHVTEMEPAAAQDPPAKQLKKGVVLALQIAAVLLLVAVVTKEGLAYRDRHPLVATADHSSVPEQVDPPSMPRPDPDLAGFPTMEKEEALTDGYVAKAARAITKGDRADWDKAIATLRSSAPAHAPSPANGYEADFARFSASLSPDNFNERQRQGLVDNLRGVLVKNPYDDESADELGWLSLLGGQRDDAKSFYLHAIWANPNRATAWYGLGVVSTDKDQTVGTLATAEMLVADPAAATQMRGTFPPLLLNLCGIKPTQFATLQTRSMDIAAKNRPASASSDAASPGGNATAGH